ncbi:stromal interaction molecule homolog isoform X3 [Dreissena polymorpha]|uniref:stromal interaction molecule homolog isoform X3 n=1 Tax=Dreissena polymorpha TaxID=45954 RepID=UPI002263FFD1|nr:stromal interaction molecule homolog isoform X3 [Dreissena polymorpha]
MESKNSVLLLAVIFLLQFVNNCQAAVQENEATDTKVPLPDENCPETDGACQEDRQNLEAIVALHKQIDDDESGNIDLDESKEFFKEELQNTDGFERQSIFHGKDDKISVEDLWNAWKKSKVYNWTVDDVLEWLVTSAEMPQYSSIFKDKNINGTQLPRVAANANHYLSQNLGIRNPVNKKKLSLKAMDVVLFGPTNKPHNILKDILLALSLVVAACGLWFAHHQNKRAKEQLQKMMSDLDSLQKAEESLVDMSEKLQKAEEVQNEVVQEKKDIERKYREEIEIAKAEAERLKHERQGSNLEEMSRLQLAEEELEQLRAALLQAEQELENNWGFGAPTELQQWLQLTYELEHQHFLAKQKEAQRQFSNAKDACEKIRRKRTGVLGTLRIAQGNSIDDIDERIVQARMALEEIRHDMQERTQRWQAIERFCGFPLRTNPGMTKLIQALYGDAGSLSRLAAVAPMNVEDADEDYPPHFPTAADIACMKRRMSLRGLGGGMGELKRRQLTMGSTQSLATQSLTCKSVSSLAHVGLKRDSEIPGIKSPVVSSSNGNHSMPVSFHLGQHSPTSSPDSPDSPKGALLEGFPRSKSFVHNSTQPLSQTARLPRLGEATVSGTPTSMKHENALMKRTDSEGCLAKRILPKQVSNIGGVGNLSQDEDSLSGTESLDSEGKKKDKKKMKFIPKFMRKTD